MVLRNNREYYLRCKWRELADARVRRANLIQYLADEMEECM